MEATTNKKHVSMLFYDVHKVVEIHSMCVGFVNGKNPGCFFGKLMPGINKCILCEMFVYW